ncbi:MAG TPA: PspC domain-containing protein [Bryobacteraceae bacterium]
MFCTQCGFELEQEDLFCAKCGKGTRPGAMPRRVPAVLSRPMDQKKIAGVCAGFARYFTVDVTLMRILWVALTVVTGGLGLLVYIGAWILMPKDYPVAGLHQEAVQHS